MPPWLSVGPHVPHPSPIFFSVVALFSVCSSDTDFAASGTKDFFGSRLVQHGSFVACDKSSLSTVIRRCFVCLVAHDIWKLIWRYLVCGNCTKKVFIHLSSGHITLYGGLEAQYTSRSTLVWLIMPAGAVVPQDVFENEVVPLANLSMRPPGAPGATWATRQFEDQPRRREPVKLDFDTQDELPTRSVQEAMKWILEIKKKPGQ